MGGGVRVRCAGSLWPVGDVVVVGSSRVDIGVSGAASEVTLVLGGGDVAPGPVVSER